jgi:hypothetical protein
LAVAAVALAVPHLLGEAAVVAAGGHQVLALEE